MKFTIVVLIIGIAVVSAANVDRMKVEFDFNSEDDDNTQLMGKYDSKLSNSSSKLSFLIYRRLFKCG